MKANELQEGKTYLANHSSGRIMVKLHHIRKDAPGVYSGAGERTRTRYLCTSLKTGREVIFRSPVKFLREVTEDKGVATKA